MKKFDSNQYFAWGLTAFGVIAASILFFMLLRHGGVVWDALQVLLGILSPIIWGLAIAYLLWPITRAFEENAFLPLFRKYAPKKNRDAAARALSAASAIIIALVVIAALLWLIIPQVYTSIESILIHSQEYYDTVTSWIGRFFEDYPQVSEALLAATGNVSDTLVDWLQTALLPSMSKLLTGLSTGIMLFLRGVLDVLIGFVVACYVLFNLEDFGAKTKQIIYSVLPLRSAESVLRATVFTNSAFMGFIRGKVIDSFIIGVICYIGCLLLRMPYAVLISVIVGVTNVIPVFGPFIGAVPSGLLILLVDPMKCLIFAIFVFVLQQVDGNIIGPKILGSSTGVSGFWIMFSILLGGGLFGVIGMLLGVPVFVVIHAGIRMLVEKGLKKRGLQTETAQYVKIDHIDEETKLPVRRREDGKAPAPAPETASPENRKK